MFERRKNNSEITIIFNRYKNTLDDFINSSDIESLDSLKQSDKESCNTSRSKSSLINLSKEDCLDKNILDMPLGLAAEIENSQIPQYYDIQILDLKNGRIQYEKS